jgi:Holliday junction resolvase RusA-like endonuclease
MTAPKPFTLHEKAALIRLANGEIVPRKVMGARYKLARDKTRTIAKQTLGNPAPSTSPLSIVARVWVPDERPHDVCNFAKCCHDALEGIVYKNDFRLYDTRWVRAGVDVDSPRAEITISPLSGSTVQET